jgi:hypothetical protein
MRTMRLALCGALALCVAASLTACSTNGSAREGPTEPAIKTVLVETPVLQLVKIDRTLTDVQILAPAPTPAWAFGTEGCDRPEGCFSNRQLEAMLSDALAWGTSSADNLRAIRLASDQAYGRGAAPPDSRGDPGHSGFPGNDEFGGRVPSALPSGSSDVGKPGPPSDGGRSGTRR